MTTDRQLLEDAASFRVRLVCWHCGAHKDVLTHGPAQFAFEIVGWAQDAGMVGYFDMARSRSLIFCNAAHAREQMTKDGRFRLRPKRAAAAIGQKMREAGNA